MPLQVMVFKILKFYETDLIYINKSKMNMNEGMEMNFYVGAF